MSITASYRGICIKTTVWPANFRRIRPRPHSMRAPAYAGRSDETYPSSRIYNAPLCVFLLPDSVSIEDATSKRPATHPGTTGLLSAVMGRREGLADAIPLFISIFASPAPPFLFLFFIRLRPGGPFATCFRPPTWLEWLVTGVCTSGHFAASRARVPT